MGSRVDKLNKMVGSALSPILNQHVDNSLFGLVTITKVIVAPNLASAKVWVSCIKNNDKFLEFIKGKMYMIQGDLNKHMHLKRNPRIMFKIDENPDYVNKIEDLLANL